LPVSPTSSTRAFPPSFSEKDLSLRFSVLLSPFPPSPYPKEGSTAFLLYRWAPPPSPRAKNPSFFFLPPGGQLISFCLSLLCGGLSRRSFFPTSPPAQETSYLLESLPPDTRVGYRRASRLSPIKILLACVQRLLSIRPTISSLLFLFLFAPCGRSFPRTGDSLFSFSPLSAGLLLFARIKRCSYPLRSYNSFPSPDFFLLSPYLSLTTRAWFVRVSPSFSRARRVVAR